ncbi:MAG TPA: LPS assembly protein LptD [Tepidisphaeraceae bacterium]|nr:LPS assembly protein LptD [Tepidisphaeraceae bacterium]
MHWTRAGLGWILIAILLPFACVSPARAQFAQVSEKLLIRASSVTNWAAGSVNILQLQGPVSVVTDDVTCSAKQAVIWLTPVPGALLHEQQVDIVLIGDATLAASVNHLTRSGPRLLVNTIVRGTVQLSASSESAKDLSQSPLYLDAQTIRGADENSGAAPSSPDASRPLTTTAPPPAPPKGGTSVSGVVQPTLSKAGLVEFHAALVVPTTADDGTSALQLGGGVTITQKSDNGDFLELLANNAVLFSSDRGAATTGPSAGGFGRHFTAAYLEGDVRMDFTPASAKKPEQRLTADRVFYDFVTQRAVLTGVVFHAIDPLTQIPIVFRAQVMRQLTHGEYTMEHSEFTTSKFAVPTFSVRNTYAYVREEPDNPGNYEVTGRNTVAEVFGIPGFYWPYLWAVVNDKPFLLRNFETGNSSRYGFTFTSEWGLFETLGQAPPKGLDISYDLDYFSERGFGGGFAGKYQGGFVTDSGEPWSYQGDFKSFLMSDHGIDNLGGDRSLVDPATDLRGRFLWEHQQFLPDDWQVQIRVGYLSDPTFLEEYYQPEFDSTLPYNAEFYAKRQQDTEALTFLAESDTTRFVTNSDRQQEQFDVARLPEITYQRIGDSFADDQLTLFSNTSGAALKFDQSAFSLAQQGFGPGLSPGLPSDGLNGTTGNMIFRADTRQEVDWPVSIGQLRVVPFVMGEATSYSDSPGGDGQNRLYGGAGLRLTTSFWRVYDSVDSDLFDIHRLRHIVQPEINLFTSATTLDQSKIYIFDPDVDALNDITGGQFALHQHWETMRGGPGRWQSVDILDFNVEADLYTHQPPASVLNPVSFRGLYFPSEPQTSVPRQAINSDLTWHIADDTAFISDVQWNLDQRETAIAEAGVAINRGSRLSYYVGDAYVQALNSQILTFNANYNLTSKYQLSVSEALDFGSSRATVTYVSVTRRFDIFSFSIAVYHDGISNTSGITANFFPVGQPGFSRPWNAND